MRFQHVATLSRWGFLYLEAQPKGTLFKNCICNLAYLNDNHFPTYPSHTPRRISSYLEGP